MLLTKPNHLVLAGVRQISIKIFRILFLLMVSWSGVNITLTGTEVDQSQNWRVSRLIVVWEEQYVVGFQVVMAEAILVKLLETANLQTQLVTFNNKPLYFNGWISNTNFLYKIKNGASNCLNRTKQIWKWNIQAR